MFSFNVKMLGKRWNETESQWTKSRFIILHFPVPFHHILFYSIRCRLIKFHPTTWYSTIFHSIRFHSIPSHWIPFCFISFHSLPSHPILSLSSLSHSIPSKFFVSFPFIQFQLFPFYYTEIQHFSSTSYSSHKSLLLLISMETNVLNNKSHSNSRHGFNHPGDLALCRHDV